MDFSTIQKRSESVSREILNLFFHLHLNGPADLLGGLAYFPQRDGQVLCPVGVQQRHLAGALLADLLLVDREVDGGPLSFRLEHLLKLVHVQVLEGRTAATLCSRPRGRPCEVLWPEETLASRILSSSISLKTVPLIWFGFNATQLKTGIRNFVLIGFLILTAR